MCVCLSERERETEKGRERKDVLLVRLDDVDDDDGDARRMSQVLKE